MANNGFYGAKSAAAVGRQQPGLWLIVVCSALSLAAVTFVDYSWTAYLRLYRWQPLTDVMRRSLFEDGRLGGSDPAILLPLGAFLVYLGSRWTQPGHAWLLSRPLSAFVLSYGILLGTSVLALKWAGGRARPNQVFRKHLTFTEWYEPGVQFLTDGNFASSFPSGHTATVLMFLMVAYLLTGDRGLSQRWHQAGWLAAAFTFLNCLAMTLASTMAGRHWISDCVGSIALGWPLMHLWYFNILNIPFQADYLRAHGRLPPLPRHWELRLTGSIVLCIFAVSLTVISLREGLYYRPSWLSLMVFPLSILAVYSYRRARCLFAAIESWRTWRMSLREYLELTTNETEQQLIHSTI